MKTALEEAKKIIEHYLNNDIDLSDEYYLQTIKHCILILNVGCQCDEYNGFDCGCSKRSAIIKNATNEFNKLKSTKKKDDYCHCIYPAFCPICKKEFAPEDNKEFN